MNATTPDLSANLSHLERPTPRRTARGAGAVLAGLVVIFAVTTASDVALHLTGVFPPLGERMSDGLFLLATAYRVAYGVLGCYVAARLAPARPLAHALTLGAIGVVLSTIGAACMWDAGPSWYSLAVIAIALPCAWVGGMLRARQLGRRA
jgi:uncharacterized membrane protein HdeD (DUF308 family)